MFNLSGSEIVVILLVALVVLGPEKLPDAIRKFGRVYAEIKKVGNGFQSEFNQAFKEPMNELKETARLTREAVAGTFDSSSHDSDDEPPRPSDSRPTSESDDGGAS